MPDGTTPHSQSATGTGSSSSSSEADAAHLLQCRGPVKISTTSAPTMFRWSAHGKEGLVCGRSLFVFDVYGPVRQHALWLVEWKWFDRCVLFLIFFSSALLAVSNSRDPGAAVNKLAVVCDPCLTVCFTLECILKIISWGFAVDAHSYLRNAWNWLDITVVATGWVSILPSGGMNLRFLLVFKVLRPLRSLKTVPQMRLLVNTVLLSIRNLGQFCLMVVFLFSVFSIVGLNFWAGVSYRQCRVTKRPVFESSLGCWSWKVAPESAGRLCGGRYMCENTHTCGSIYSDEVQVSLRPDFGNATWKPGRVLDEGAPWCADTLNTWEAPDFNFHFTHFDHMLGALLVVFQCMTMEGWVDLMYLLQDGDSDIIASIYFVILVSATAFFLLNAALAIVTETFEEAMQEDKEEKEEKEDNSMDEKAVGQSRDVCEATSSTHTGKPKGAWGEDGQVSKEQDILGIKCPSADEDEASPRCDDQVRAVEPEDDVGVSTTPAHGSRSEGSMSPGRATEKRTGPDEGPKELFADEDGAQADHVEIPLRVSTRSAESEELKAEEEFMQDQNWSEPAWLDTKIVHAARAVASNEWFVNVVMFFILFNVVTMCLDTYPPPPTDLQIFLNTCNLVFAVAFSIEMIVLLVALGPLRYWTKVMTAFDGVVVIAGWVEISMSGAGGAVRAFRGLRLLRIFKLAKKWTSFRVMIKAMMGTVMALGNLGVLLIIMIFIFTLMGRELFALEFHFDDDGRRMADAGRPSCFGEAENYDCVPRAHFDTFLWAFVTVFQILSGENWNVVMYDGMKSNPILVVYYVLVMVFGQFIMLSLFLAVLMSKFEESRDAQQELEKIKKEELRSRKPSKQRSSDDLGNDSPSRMARFRAYLPFQPSRQVHPIQNNAVAPTGFGNDDATNRAVAVVPGASADTSEESVGAHDVAQKAWSWPHNYAFLVLSPDNLLRKLCRQTVENKRFDNAVLICIVLASLAMALDLPLSDPTGPLPVTLYWMGVLFTTIFSVEMLLKMVAYGCLFGCTNGNKAYWQQPWNILDGTVVTVSVLDLTLAGTGALGAMKTLRIMRALRPLRVVARFENLRLVVQTLFKSVPALANVLIVGVLVFLIFALFFLSYFKGKFYACMDVADGELDSLSGFESNVSYVLDASGTLPQSLFLSNGSQIALAALQLSRLRLDQPTPLCINTTSGMVTALGQKPDHRKARWMFDGACPAGHVLLARPTKDAPICVGRCNAKQGKDDHRPAQCPPPPEKVEELPSFCPSAYGGIPLSAALQLNNVVTSSAEERRGFDYYASLTRRDVMFCGKSTVGPNSQTSFPGCLETYCPLGCAEPPCDDRKASCKRDCETHPIYCQDSCGKGKESSSECKVCQAQCEAQCQCSEYCSGFVKDAGNCVEQGGRWDLAISQSFDNIFSAFLTLVEISTTEGWVDVMYQAVDAVNPHMQPVRDQEELWSVAFMFFIFVSFFFYINLCVGVIVDNYNEIKDSNGAAILTKKQMDWIATHKSLHKRTHFFGLTNLPSLPRMQVLAYRLITWNVFENFIMLCIICNTVSMAMKSFPTPSPLYEELRELFSQICGAIFFLEMLVKLFALRLNYFKEKWNIFDFCCVMSSLIGLVISLASDIEIASAMSAIRTFRIARLFRLVRFLKGLNRMFTALLLSLPKLINVGGILLLFFFLFSVLGVQLFAKTKFHGPHNFHANFRDPGRAFLTLLRSVTGEGWNELMHAFSRDLTFFTQSMGDACVSEDMFAVNSDTYPVLKQKCLIDEPNACGKDLSYLYFIAFTCVMTMVMVNLMIAVILEAFSDSSSNELIEVIDTCISMWPKYDRDLVLHLTMKDTFTFIIAVANEYGVDLSEAVSEDEKKKRARIKPKLFSSAPDFKVSEVPMRIAKLCEAKVLPDGRVHFLYAVRMAVALTLSANSSSDLREFQTAEENDEKLQSLRSKQLQRLISQDEGEKAIPLQKQDSLAEQVGVLKIQDVYRNMKNFKMMKMKREESESAAQDQRPPAELIGSIGEPSSAADPPDTGEPEQELKPREAG